MLGFNIDVLCVFACMCLILFILFHLTFFFFFKNTSLESTENN